jgi:exosortase C (VPDSG-CTERM-specific)
MKQINPLEAHLPKSSPFGGDFSSVAWRRWKRAAIALVVMFGWWLWHLLRFSLAHDLYSHILLIPGVTAYLLWLRRPELPRDGSPSRALAMVFVAGGICFVGGYFIALSLGERFSEADALALTTAGFLCFLFASGAWFLGARIMRAAAFPLAMLIFMIPMPDILTGWIETGLQHGSAAVAGALFAASGATVFHEGLVFQLPGITLQVAPECSGIHSSLALLITSLVAGQLFLESGFKRTVLAVAVIPLALLRNGFRVFVLGELCVHVGPHMIDSYIHHHGGPIFFALSLVPFSFLLVRLARSERKTSAAAATPASAVSQ